MEDPSLRKVTLKGYLEHQKAAAKTVLTKLQYVTSWEWAWVGEKAIFQMIFVLHRWKRKSYMFKMTWEWVNDDTVFILGEISL